MKKTLLTFVAFFAMMSMALAQTFTWTGADWAGVADKAQTISMKAGDFTFTANKENGGTAPTVNGTTNDLRIYANGTLNVASTKNFSRVVFNLSAKGKQRLAEITADAGNVAIDTQAWTVTWTGDAKSVTLTVGSKAVHGTDGASKSGQFDIASIVVGEGGGEVKPDPTPDPTPDPQPQPEGDVIFSETFAEGLGAFVFEDKVKPASGDTVWKHAAYNEKVYAKASAFDGKNKVGYDSESWLVSPVIDLTKATNSTLSFDQAANFFKGFAGRFVKVKAEGSDWTDVTIAGDVEKDSWTFVSSTVDLKAFDGKKVQIAFVYKSEATKCGTWEVNNVKVTAASSTGIEGVEAENGAQVIYDLSGRRVAKAVKGLYIINGKKVYVK